jgi:predicted amidohydrolase
MGIRPYASLDEMIFHLEEHATAAKAVNSDVLLFPEMANVGLLWMDPSCSSLDPRQMGGAYDRLLTPLFEPFRDSMSEVAAKCGLTIIGPSFWHKTDGVGTNTTLVFFPDGHIHRQDKIHPTRPEVAIDTQGGARVSTFEINGIKAAVLICYDNQFPELIRPLADAGIQVLFAPTLTGWRGYWRVRYAAQARAQENQMYVCVSALFGDLGIPEEMPLTCNGRSYVTCPIDNRFGIVNGLFAEGPADEEGLLTVDLDFDLLNLSREKGEIRNIKDRRPDLYPTLRAD